MASNVVLNGVTYSIPVDGDSGWGPDLTNYFLAIPTATLQKTGGSFTLTAEANFGTVYGLKLPYIKSQATNPSATGIVRLGNAEKVSWRNAANSDDLYLNVDASNNLNFNGAVLQAAMTVSDTATIDMTLAGIDISAAIKVDSITNAMINSAAAIAYSKLNLTASVVNADISASAAIAYSKLALSGSIVNADISASAAIALSKLATVSASKVLVSDGSGFVSASSVTSTELALLSGKTGVLVTEAGTQTLTGKTIAAGSNTITGLTNAAIDAAAAIARSKLASGSNSHVLINDGSGVMSSEAQLAISRGGTGQSTANAALNALLPSQTSQSGKFLSTNGTDSAWTSGAANLSVVSKTTTYNATVSDDVILCSTAGGAWTLGLPTAVGNTGKVLQIKKTTNDFTALTIDGNGSETIDGSLTTTLDTQYETIRITSDGTNWQLLNRTIPSMWTAYTPTFTNLGTVTGITFAWKRNGDSLEVYGVATTGTIVASEARVSYPSGLTSVSTLPTLSGRGTAGLGSTGSVGDPVGSVFLPLVEPSVGYMTFGRRSSGGGSFSKLTGSSFGSSVAFSVHMDVPITGWKG